MKIIIISLFALFCASNLYSARLPLTLHMGKPVLSARDIPAKGTQEVLLTIPSPGKYSICAKSTGRVALNVISRLDGPKGWTSSDKIVKERRYDLILDKGTYKVLVKSPNSLDGKVSLSVAPFKELNGEWPSKIQEHKLVKTSLGDKVQRSFWLEVTKGRYVAIEAAGRNLSDLALWKDGSWLVEAKMATSSTEPTVGRPLKVKQLYCWLEPGVYLLSAYGGEASVWAAGGEENPLFIRYGITTLPEVGRRRFNVGPFGYDRFLVPAQANYLRLELDKPRQGTISAATYDEARPFPLSGSSRTITKKTKIPVAELSVYGRSSGYRIVTVESEAGSPYILQHFQSQSSLSFTGSGDYWLSTIGSGHAADQIDASGLIISTNRYRSVDKRIEHTDLPELSSDEGWVRQFNLLNETSLLVNIREQAHYQVLAEGADIEVRIEPFYLVRPRNYRSPSFRPAGTQWPLNRGYHTLTLRPRRKGVVEVALFAIGGKSPKKSAAKSSCRFPVITTDKSRRYTVEMGRVPNSERGFILRKLPLDLQDALPVNQLPGESLNVTFTVKEPGILRALSSEGEELGLSVNGATARKNVLVDRGTHRVTVKNESKRAIDYSLFLEPKILSTDTPLPQLSKNVLRQLPDFPSIDEGRPRFFDLKRNQRKTFLVRAREAALFRIESMGLLATSGTVRTRTVPSLASRSGNGVGRNFLVQHYLGRGDYQVTVKAEGQSQGHLGLRLRKTAMTNGGTLALGIPARITLEPSKAITYSFEIKEAGTYGLLALGLGRYFPCILTDHDGWPLLKPGRQGVINRHFDVGTYHFVLLPEGVKSRRVVLLERNPIITETKGHGPHALALNESKYHLWKEPVPGQERKPDVWLFDLPAQVEVTISLTNKMEGTLFRFDGKEFKEQAFIPMSKTWKNTLPDGRYRLETVCARKNNNVDYRVGLSVVQLVDGQKREIRDGQTIPVSVGRGGIVELSSIGACDTRATLFDKNGKIIAKSDDRNDDWNFLISKRLTSGFYSLKVDCVGSSREGSLVSMRTLREEVRDTIHLPFDETVKLASKVFLYPVEGTAKGGVLVLSAQSDETIGCAIEKSAGNDWHVVAANVGRKSLLVVPLKKGVESSWLFRLWSVDRRGNPARITMKIVEPERVKPGNLKLTSIAGIVPPTALVKVEGNESSAFELSANVPVQVSDEALKACSKPEESTFGVSGKSFWLAAPLVKDTKVTVEPTALSQKNRLLRLRLANSGAAIGCDLNGKNEGPKVTLLRSVIGQPAVTVEGAAKTTMALGKRAALTFLPNSAARIAMWSACHEDIRVIAEYKSFAKPAEVKVNWQGLGGSIEGSGSRELLLPKGMKKVRLTIDSSVVAAVMESEQKIESVHWGDGERLVTTVETESRKVVLLNMEEQSGRFSVKLLPLETKRKEFSGLCQIFAPYRGRNSISLNPLEDKKEKRTLYLRGAILRAKLITNNGNIQDGLDLSYPPSGGRLIMDHGPGTIVFWSQGEKSTKGLCHPPNPAFEDTISPPAQRQLLGKFTLLKIKAAGTAVAHVRTVAPVISIVQSKKGEIATVSVHEKGCNLDLLLTDGEKTIGFRPLFGDELYGPVEVTSSSITALGEGLGPESLIAPGSSRFYSFAVKRKGAIGVGVRSAPDIIECTLLDSKGSIVDEGVVQMPRVEPGNFYLKLHVAKDGQPVVARPALAGIAPPDTGPPGEVVAKYLKSYSPTGGNQ